MAASSRGFSAHFDFKPTRRLLPLHSHTFDPRKRRKVCFEHDRVRVSQVTCCCSDSVNPIRSESCEKSEEWRFDSRKSSHRVRVQASPAMPFASPYSNMKQEKFYPCCTPGYSGLLEGPSIWPIMESKRACLSMILGSFTDTGIANEKDWDINLMNENMNESGTNEDGSTWYRENGEELGRNGYRCRLTRMGGQSHDGSSEWKETWCEKGDCTGYKELGLEKSVRNAEGDSWWETWQENLHQDEWSNIARIERSAQKQAKSGTENAGWYEKWWEKYDAKGWTEKGAHKYVRLNEKSWWEKWGENYDGRGSALKWTDKWAETELGTKWRDKWEERFFEGIGSRHGETWHVSPSNERWSRTWGEEHFGNGKVHKYGNSTTGKSWDIVVDEETYYEAEPPYGWADVLAIQATYFPANPRRGPLVSFPTIWTLIHPHLNPKPTVHQSCLLPYQLDFSPVPRVSS